MAALSGLTGVSDRTALLLISFPSSFLGVALAYRLGGGWVAGFFAVLSFDWMQRSYLGRSEPLFVALLFGSFVGARKERWLLAALRASLATVVRPLGVFALLGIGDTLLWKRAYRKFLLARDRHGGGSTLHASPRTSLRRSPGNCQQLSQPAMAGRVAFRISVLCHHPFRRELWRLGRSASRSEVTGRGRNPPYFRCSSLTVAFIGLPSRITVTSTTSPTLLRRSASVKS
jgi:hypothetical protein